MIHNRRLATANIGVAVGAFGIATFMALMQALSRAALDLPGRSAKMYYLSVTAHGVLMALVFTTFFIMGLGIAFTTTRRRSTGRCAGRGWGGARSGLRWSAPPARHGRSSGGRPPCSTRSTRRSRPIPRSTSG